VSIRSKGGRVVIDNPHGPDAKELSLHKFFKGDELHYFENIGVLKDGIVMWNNGTTWTKAAGEVSQNGATAHTGRKVKAGISASPWDAAIRPAAYRRNVATPRTPREEHTKENVSRVGAHQDDDSHEVEVRFPRGVVGHHMENGNGAPKKAQEVSEVRLLVGSPVTFFIEGRALEQLFGRIRNIAENGTYTVDLVGGGRMSGLDAVTLCPEKDLRKAEQLKVAMMYVDQNSSSKGRGLSTSSKASTRNPTPNPHVAAVQPSCGVGCPVSFFCPRSRLKSFGRVRSLCPDGTVAVDLVGGGCVNGVGRVDRCNESDLEWAAQRTNSPMRFQSDGGVSQASSPAISPRQIASARQATPVRYSPAQGIIESGSPVSFFEVNYLGKRYGRIRILHGAGYTIDLVGGGVKVGVPVDAVERCSESDFAKEAERIAQAKRFIKTSKDSYSDYATRNTTAAATLGANFKGVAIARVSRDVVTRARV